MSPYHSRISFKIRLYWCVLCLSVSVATSGEGYWWRSERGVKAPRREVVGSWSRLVWLLETELGPSGRTMSIPPHRAIFPAPKSDFKNHDSLSV